MATAEGRQHPRGLRVDEVLGHADAYGGLHRGTGQCLRHFLVQVEHAPRIAEQGVAGIGGMHIAVAPFEQAVPGHRVAAVVKLPQSATITSARSRSSSNRVLFDLALSGI
ncbi:hypothetical protein G6F32_015743 [Rhizopus arrhizus]|nr:hypothetical protein G6F32_015743 [Rhizopus arrhizus]